MLLTMIQCLVDFSKAKIKKLSTAFVNACCPPELVKGAIYNSTILLSL